MELHSLPHRVNIMMKRLGLGLLFLCLAIGPALPQAVAQDKTKTKASTAKTADVVVEGVLAVSLDVNARKAVVKTDDGEKTVTMSKDVAVVGPRGGERKDGLEDEELDPGAKVRLTTPAGGRVARKLEILAAAPAKVAAPAKTETTKTAKTKTPAKADTAASPKADVGSLRESDTASDRATPKDAKSL